jgi:hypothetical protein
MTLLDTESCLRDANLMKNDMAIGAGKCVARARLSTLDVSFHAWPGANRPPLHSP